jgi:ribosome biogenesis GTPase
LLTGKIIKGIGGFYYVAVDPKNAEGGETKEIIYETRARGLFRMEGLRPLVGDDCEIAVTDAEKHTGNIEKILPRRSMLIRPAVANTDQAIVIFAVSKPEPHTGLMDRYLVQMEVYEVPVILVLNKIDQDEEAGKALAEIYRKAGFTVVLTSAKTGVGMSELKRLMKGKTSVLSGPSGVGKSSIINALFPGVRMETGEISKKIGRGKHTTRHSELMVAGDDTFLFDTPGFSSVELPEKLDEESLPLYFPEFQPYLGKCKFSTCRHLSEPDCRVKEALAEGKIEKSRYENYAGMMDELAKRRKY